MAARRAKPKPINLALQGGGAHGAFTWGVLDALLESEKFAIKEISGTSAGAMNAVVLAEGYHRDGADGARKALAEFWKKMGTSRHFSPVQRSIIDVLFNNYNLDHTPGYLFFDVVSRFYGPYDFNPLNLNPLRDVLVETVDFDRVRDCEDISLHISATNVRNGKVRVFGTAEISPETVMASACLPFLYQAVEIDGVPYWDGGYMGNPALFPFFKSDTDDIVLVQINPIHRTETPRTARDILNRVNEITFNSSLLKEFRAIEFVARLVEDGKLDPKEYKKVRMHRIDASVELQHLNASSKLNTETRFLDYLFETGRRTALEWMETDGLKVGRTGTINLREEIAYTAGGDATGF